MARAARTPIVSLVTDGPTLWRADERAASGRSGAGVDCRVSDSLQRLLGNEEGIVLGARAPQRLEPDPRRTAESFLGTFFFFFLGRHFPQLPLKILPRADLVSPLPISVLFARRLARAFRLYLLAA